MQKTGKAWACTTMGKGLKLMTPSDERLRKAVERTPMGDWEIKARKLLSEDNPHRVYSEIIDVLAGESHDFAKWILAAKEVLRGRQYKWQEYSYGGGRLECIECGVEKDTPCKSDCALAELLKGE